MPAAISNIAMRLPARGTMAARKAKKPRLI
jgi:hypothetical protein